MKEVCSCRAVFEIYDVKIWATEALLEAFANWRANHRHESGNHDVPPQSEGDMPHIFESQGSAIERSWPLESETHPTVQLGFQREA